MRNEFETNTREGRNTGIIDLCSALMSTLKDKDLSDFLKKTQAFIFLEDTNKRWTVLKYDSDGYRKTVIYVLKFGQQHDNGADDLVSEIKFMSTPGTNVIIPKLRLLVSELYDDGLNIDELKKIIDSARKNAK